MSESSPSAESDQRETSPINTTIAETEQWFVSQGLPHFAPEYTATEKIFPRMSPILALSFLITVTLTIHQEWPLWLAVVTSLASFLVLVGIWAVANRARGLPALRSPRMVGPVEIAVYLFGPAVLNVLARNSRVAGLTILGHAILLVTVYYATSYGFVSMTIGNFRHVFERVGLALRLLGRTFPILFLTVTFLLFNARAWESTNLMPLRRYLALLALFIGTTLVFLYRGITAEFEMASSFDSPEEIRELCVGSPVDQIASTIEIDPSEVPPLTQKERRNVVLLATYGFAGYITVVTLVMLVFFILFGLLMLPTQIIADMLESTPSPVVTVTLLDIPVTLTRELVRVSGFFAAFTGLYFTIHAVTDQTFRKELDGSIRTYVRKALAVRAVYHVLTDSREDSASG